MVFAWTTAELVDSDGPKDFFGEALILGVHGVCADSSRPCGL